MYKKVAKKYMETCFMLAVIRERQIKAISLLLQWPQLRGGVEGRCWRECGVTSPYRGGRGSMSGSLLKT